MVQAAVRWRDRDDSPQEDHIVHLDGATWEDYERLLELRGENAVPRITYLEGLIEIMSPSRPHEGIKSVVGRLVEVWCLEHQTRFTAVGSWTLKEQKEERGAEPDECYIFGDPDVDRPHLAIEVVWTTGGINKLEIYRKLGVAEVWYWKKGELRPYVLRGEHYEAVEASEVLPDIDLAELASFVDRPSTYDAITEYRDALRARGA